MNKELVYKLFHLDEQTMSTYIKKMAEIKKQLENHILPEAYPEEISSFEFIMASAIDKNICRDKFIALCGFSLVSKDWLRILADWLKDKKCLEIMAGLGCISYGLKEMGIDIVATDDYSWKFKNKWTEVEEIDCIEAIQKYIKERPYVIVSWPEMNNNALDALLEMRKLNPDARMLFIGEFGDCCANEAFVDAAEVIHTDLTKQINNKLQSWSGIRDLFLFIK